jgi:hypothetical protein
MKFRLLIYDIGMLGWQIDCDRAWRELVLKNELSVLSSTRRHYPEASIQVELNDVQSESNRAGEIHLPRL